MYASSITRGLTLSTCGVIHHYTTTDQDGAPTTSVDANGRVSYTHPSSRFAFGHGNSSPVVLAAQQIRTVTAILVLSALPRDLAASIIAHEAMHAYCKLTVDMPLGLAAQVEALRAQVGGANAAVNAADSSTRVYWEGQVRNGPGVSDRTH